MRVADFKWLEIIKKNKKHTCQNNAICLKIKKNRQNTLRPPPDTLRSLRLKIKTMSRMTELLFRRKGKQEGARPPRLHARDEELVMGRAEDETWNVISWETKRCRCEVLAPSCRWWSSWPRRWCHGESWAFIFGSAFGFTIAVGVLKETS